MTAADVKYSFESMSGKYAAPGLRASLAGVERAVVLDERTVRFDLRERTNDMLFTVGGLSVFSRKWALGPDGKPKRFDEIVSEYPITSGPVHDRQGRFGPAARVQAQPRLLGARPGRAPRHLQLGPRGLPLLQRPGGGARGLQGRRVRHLQGVQRPQPGCASTRASKWDDGRIKKDLFETSVGQGLQAYMLNMRRPLFQDIRVREALGYTYDFDTVNRLGLYKRANSLFNNSEFAAQGLPTPGELKLLEPFRAELPPEVFGPAYRGADAPAATRSALRQNLLKARELLEQAGWKLAPDGKLRNAKGEAFEFEYLSPGEGGGRMADWQTNLEKLGITMKERNVDFALYRRRLEEYDFDMIAIAGGDFTLPDATGLLTAFGSKSADEKGNNNFRGVKSRAADHLIKLMSEAQTLEELRDASRALDRVIMWSHWQVPDLYASDEKSSYWNKFGMPAQRPRFFTIDTGSGFAAWPLETWWIKDPAKR